MQIFSLFDNREQIRAIYNKYGEAPIPISEILNSLGKDAFRDLKGLRYFRKAGYLATSGTFSTRRMSTRDRVCFELTPVGIEALKICYLMDNCPLSCRRSNSSFKKCRRCIQIPTIPLLNN